MYFLKNLLITLKITASLIFNWFVFSPFTISQVDVDKPVSSLITSLQTFEIAFSYPFSNTEKFSITHGYDGDYFAFFKSLGKPYFYTTINRANRTVTKIINGQKISVNYTEGELAAVGCAILRTLKTNENQPIKAWYLCDVKVQEKYQGEHLMSLMSKKLSLSLFTTCTSGYAICMNPPDNAPKAARVFKKHGSITWTTTKTLNIYSLTHEKLIEHFDAIQQIFIQHGYLNKDKENILFTSTSGKKDYLIFNASSGTSRPWKLIHLTRGKKITQPQLDTLDKEATFMICAIDKTPLDNSLQLILQQPSSTAQVISYGMDNVDFNFLTSNQI